MGDRRPYKSAAERKADILQATVDLLAEYGPSSVSVRQIAERAGVQHTLIFRHFGDKTTLIGQAMIGELLGWAEAARTEPSPVEAFIAGFRYLCKRRQAAAALGLTMSGASGPAVEQRTFPVVDTYVEILVAAGMSQRSARDLAMTAVAVITSWVAAEDWWLTVGGYRGVTGRARGRRAMEKQIRQIVEAGLAAHGVTP
jgi:AcrR family transcriptional regulator